MIWFLIGVALAVIVMKIKRAVWCAACVGDRAQGHTRECQIRHISAWRSR